MKNYIIAMILLFALFSCEQKNTVQTSKDIQQSEAVARRLFELFNEHKWQEMSALYTDSAEFTDPSFGSGVVKQSREQIVKKYAAMAEESPDIRDSVTAVYPSGNDHVVVEFTSIGTTTDGMTWSLPICSVLTFRNGLIIRDNTYYDIPQ